MMFNIYKLIYDISKTRILTSNEIVDILEVLVNDLDLANEIIKIEVVNDSKFVFL